MNSTYPARLRFLGATDTVTGSRYLLESGDTRILVDCGLFQGYKRIRDRNRIPFPVSPGSIDAVLLTHAHLDHTGYVPALVRDGFTGPVYATHGTSELCKLLLPDSGHLQEEEARYADHRGSSMHVPALPVYTAADAVRSLNAFAPRDFDAPLDLGDGVEATFLPAGHILGAAQIRVYVDGHSIHFTGDLGRADDPLMFPPRELEATDILATESTYGNRSHPDQDPAAELGAVVSRVAKRGGVVMIAAFAVGRAETLMLHLSRLRRSGMLTGGRILHHLEAYGPDPKNAIILSGYQAGGTRGADLAAGAKELRIYGQDVPILAEVIQIEGFSAHADADEIIRWMHTANQAPHMTYVTHGEPAASDALRRRIKRELGWNARVPEHLEAVPLDDPH